MQHLGKSSQARLQFVAWWTVCVSCRALCSLEGLSVYHSPAVDGLQSYIIAAVPR